MIERLLITSSADISYEAMKQQIKNELGEFQVLPVSDTSNVTVLIHGTKLFFNDGAYTGSKADLTDHLSHWGIGNSEL